MSGLTKARPRKLEQVVVTAEGIAPIDPILELKQPGGPFPPGFALLSDGMGGWIIEPTVRPYFLSFALTDSIPKLDEGWCQHQGVDTSAVGPVLTVTANIIGLSISVDSVPLKSASYVGEILLRNGKDYDLLASIDLVNPRRKHHVRDLSVHLPAGAELAARVRQTEGQRKSKFSKGLLLLELEH